MPGDYVPEVLEALPAEAVADSGLDNHTRLDLHPPSLGVDRLRHMLPGMGGEAADAIGEALG